MTSPDRDSATGARRPRRLFLFTLYSLLVTALVGTAAHDAPLNPDDPAYLRRQYVWFQAQEPARQQQLRRLHAEFTGLAPDEQAKLAKVMQTYNAWVARLPEEDRKQVLAAPTAAARLETIRQLREREWVASLPRAYRDEYATLDGDARKLRVQEWRVEETERREEWILAQKHWGENQGRIPALFQNEIRPQLEAFVNHLRENLSDAERKELEEARAAADDFGNYFGYAREVIRLADSHPLLPGHVGPKDFASLPAEVKDYLRKTDPHFRRKGDEPKELRRVSGRWPEFALELTRYCQKNNLKLPVPLGDCRKDQMPPEVIQFLDKVLEPQLKKESQPKKADAGKAELEALNKAQGSWPEYPRMIVDLAKKYKLHIPGWTLPGQQQQWDKLRTGKPRLK